MHALTKSTFVHSLALKNSCSHEPISVSKIANKPSQDRRFRLYQRNSNFVTLQFLLVCGGLCCERSRKRHSASSHFGRYNAKQWNPCYISWCIHFFQRRESEEKYISNNIAWGECSMLSDVVSRIALTKKLVLLIHFARCLTFLKSSHRSGSRRRPLVVHWCRHTAIHRTISAALANHCMACHLRVEKKMSFHTVYIDRIFKKNHYEQL